MLNEYLRQKLFVDETRDNLYRRWFSMTWGCPELFEEFLRLSSTQSQKTLAMDIVQQMTSVSEFAMPHSAFANLIEVEHQGDDWDWINQEHAVHSVNVYICGIYLFFHYQPLQQQLLQYFLKLSLGRNKYQSPMDEAVEASIQCIRMAALYHDLGYTLERTVNVEGRFNPTSGINQNDLLVYQLMRQEVIYDIVKKAVSHYLFAQVVINQTNHMLEAELRKQNWITDTSLWYCYQKESSALMHGTEFKNLSWIADVSLWDSYQNSKPVDGQTLKKRLKAEVADMTEVTYIRSWEGMKYLAVYMPAENVLTVVRDSQLRPLVIHFISAKKPVVYCRKDFTVANQLLPHLCDLKLEELEAQGISLNYYVRRQMAPLPRQIAQVTNSFADIARQCRKRFSCDFGPLFQEGKIPQLLNKINQWIERKVPLTMVDQIDNLPPRYGDQQTAIDNALITRLYQEKAIKIIKNQKIEVPSPKRQLESLGKNFLAEIKGTEFLNELYLEYNRISNADPDSNCDAQLLELVKIIYHSIKKTLTLEKPVIELEGNSESPNVIFRGLDKGRFSASPTMRQFQQRLEDNARHLNLSWQRLQNYVPRNNYYDHGMISAGLFIEGYGTYSEVMEKLGDSPFFQSVWQMPGALHDRPFGLSNATVEACFAILMHNIYVKSRDYPQGLEFIQNTSINAMSYFLAFCDSIQFWDRDKLFDPARQRQPENTYYGKDFDIDICKDKICIRCRTAGAKERIQTKLRGMDEFLQDASSMISVVESI